MNNDTPAFNYPEKLNPVAAAFLSQMPKMDYDSATIPEIRDGMKDVGSILFGGPEQNVIIGNRTICDSIPVRIYTPIMSDENNSLPIMVYFHGGAWCLGNLDMVDNFGTSIANLMGMVVVSVDYRLAPENPFPAGFNDTYDAFEWVVKNASLLRSDSNKVIVGGASAGANLAAAVCLQAKKENGPEIFSQLLIYPVTDISSLETESYRLFGDNFGLQKTLMQKTLEAYVPEQKHRSNEYVSPLLAKDFSGLPPAIVLTAGFDPLRDEGAAFAKKLDTAGVNVKHLNYPDMVHGFIEFANVYRERSKEGIRDICETLNKWLKQ